MPVSEISIFWYRYRPSLCTWLCPKWRTVWKSLLLSERLWHFTALYKHHFITVGRHFENSCFYERFVHVAVLYKRHCVSCTCWKAWYTYYYTHFLSLECLPRRPPFISRPWLTRNYCHCCMPANVSISWQTEAYEASDPYTQSSIEQNSLATVDKMMEKGFTETA